MAIEQCLSVDNTVLDYGSLSELGRSYTRTFVLKNNCEHEIKVSGEVVKYAGEGATEAADQASEWLNFVGGENKFTMGSKENKTVSMRVYLPEKVDSGSYYAGINLKNDSSEQFDEEYADIIRMTARLDILGAGANLSGVLDKNSAIPLSLGGKVAASAKLHNTGTVGYQVGYKLEKSNAFGLEHYESLVEKNAELSAGGELEFKGSDYTENQYGIYKIKQTVNYVNTEGERVESVLVQTVVNLPWVSVFIAGGCLFALILLTAISKAIKLNKKNKKDSDEELEEEIEAEEKEEEELLERPEPKPAKVIKKDKKAKKAAKAAEKAKAKAEKAKAKAEKAEAAAKKAEK